LVLVKTEPAYPKAVSVARLGVKNALKGKYVKEINVAALVGWVTDGLLW
jgi:hypothetical protein